MYIPLPSQVVLISLVIESYNRYVSSRESRKGSETPALIDMTAEQTKARLSSTPIFRLATIHLIIESTWHNVTFVYHFVDNLSRQARGTQGRLPRVPVPGRRFV